MRDGETSGKKWENQMEKAFLIIRSDIKSEAGVYWLNKTN